MQGSKKAKSKSAGSRKSSKVKPAKSKKIRYAVIGLGHIAQSAMLPAFRNAESNSELTTLISDDAEKLKKLGKLYGVKNVFHYDQYREALQNDLFDAVYIAVPNSHHRDFAVEAARFGKHVLCEKPLGLTASECEEMISTAQENNVRLMTAYRLHFDKANMEIARLIEEGKIGEPKFFTSSFSYQVKPDNIRVNSDLGGGALYDIGIYCINAARYLFKDEPVRVFAVIPETKDPRFQEVEGSACVTMQFAEGKVAQFTCSFSAEPTSWYEVLGTKGRIFADSAYEYADGIECQITVKEKSALRKFSRRDQFAPELIYFSNCIMSEREPEPSGVEGLADVRIIEALLQSARLGQPVDIAPLSISNRPSTDQIILRPATHKPPALVNAEGASV